MSMTEAEVRDFARFLAPDRADPVELRQGVVTGFDGVKVLVRLGGSAFSVGINKLSTFSADVGDTAWLLKRGPDLMALAIQRLSRAEGPFNVGDAGQPAFGTNWSNFGGGWPGAHFWKDEEGWVHLGGLVKHTSGGIGTTIFTLPAGYAPATAPAHVTIAGDLVSVVSISTAGVVSLVGPNGAASFLNLSGIRFFAGTLTDYIRYSHGNYHFFEGRAFTYDPSANRIPFIFYRDDGFVRSTGEARMATGGTLGHVGTCPDVMSGIYSDMYAVAQWSGSAWQGARIDISGHQTGLIMTTGSTAAGNSYFMDFGYWARESEEGWNSLGLQNSWVAYGQGFSTAQYRKDKNGIVHLRGLIKNGTLAISGLIATLPVGFRPVGRTMVAICANNTERRLDVDVDGTIRQGNAWGSNAFASLNNMFFRSE